MDNYTSPLSLTPEQRKANLVALNARVGRAAARVAADPRQSKTVRAANARDAATARRIASKLR